MRQRLARYCAVFCIASSTLAFELLQTRVLSALYFNNIVYLTVTVALMGFGISGVLVSIFGSKVRSPEKFVAVSIGVFSICAVGCLRFASFMPVLFPASTIIKLVLSYAVLVFPFLFSGTALGLIFMVYGKDIYRLYFVDLAASAVGALGFTLLLRPLGADALIWLIAGVTLCGFAIFAFTAKMSKILIASVVAIFLLAFYYFRFDLVNDQPEPKKWAGYLKNQRNAKIEYTEWTTIAKIDVWSGSEPETSNKIITQDGDASTAMPSIAYSEGTLLKQSVPESWLKPQSLPYLIRPNPENVLVIGPGGGQEMVIALAFGAKRITGVEINPATYDFYRGRYEDFLWWPKQKNVTLHCAEGRHFIRSAHAKYDVISMTGIDTFAALNSGAYVLAEN